MIPGYFDRAIVLGLKRMDTRTLAVQRHTLLDGLGLEVSGSLGFHELCAGDSIIHHTPSSA